MNLKLMNGGKNVFERKRKSFEIEREAFRRGRG